VTTLQDLDTKLGKLDRLVTVLERLADHLDAATLPLTMSKTRAARELDISVTQLNRLIKRGDIRLNRDRKVPSSELLRYAAAEGRAPKVSKAERFNARAEAEKHRRWTVP
jgi:hypothetical protein